MGASAPEPLTVVGALDRAKAFFERALWESRLLVIVAVVVSVGIAFASLYMSTLDALALFEDLAGYASAGDHERRHELRSESIARIVEIVDGYLLATFMFIFGLGLYELFVSKFDAADGSSSGSRLLVVHSLDDLKDRLAKIVLLILVVLFFEYALKMTPKSALDHLYLAVGIALVAAALYLSHGKGHAPARAAEGGATAPAAAGRA